MPHSFRVLLVEDDDSLRVCLREFLADLGWAVADAARGEEAIRLVEQQRFDFSILDFHLPGGANGLQVFEAIRRIKSLPAILMSGEANREETARARQAGFFTFLRKPLELERLRNSMFELIAHHFGGQFGGPLPGRPQPRDPRSLRSFDDPEQPLQPPRRPDSPPC